MTGRRGIPKYSRRVSREEIRANDYNLNIPRYVDTFEPEEEIDLNAVAAEIRNIQTEIKGIDAQLKPFFDELGLDFPFDAEIGQSEAFNLRDVNGCIAVDEVGR